MFNFAVQNKNLRQQTALEQAVVKKCMVEQIPKEHKEKVKKAPTLRGQFFKKCYTEKKGSAEHTVIFAECNRFAIAEMKKHKGETPNVTEENQTSKTD